MINQTLLKERLAMIAGYYQELRELKELPRDVFMETRNWAAAESFLRRSLEGVFDIGRHILSKSGGVDLAREYKGIAIGLGSKKVVDEEMTQKLAEMAGYRNRMVHLYHQVSQEELYNILQYKLDDLGNFIKQINQFLNSMPK